MDEPRDPVPIADAPSILADGASPADGELVRARKRIESLERQCDFITVHARNLELELRRLRRERREAVREVPRLAPDDAFWRRRYEEVVASWSWRLMWRLGTPVRAWITFRRRQAGAAPR